MGRRVFEAAVTALLRTITERLNDESHRRIKTQTVLPCVATVPMLLWALLAAGRILVHQLDGWHMSATIEALVLHSPVSESLDDHLFRGTSRLVSC